MTRCDPTACPPVALAGARTALGAKLVLRGLADLPVPIRERPFESFAHLWAIEWCEGDDGSASHLGAISKRAQDRGEASRISDCAQGRNS